MKALKTISNVLVMCAIASTLACSDRPPKAPDIAGDIRHSLDQAGLNDVSVSQDRDKNVVTLTGKVATDDDKAKAESIARSIAGTEVVSNEIGVRPGGEEMYAGPCVPLTGVILNLLFRIGLRMLISTLKL